jgi:hypothetical protein
MKFWKDKSPSGKTIVRSVSSGEMTGADAKSYIDRIQPGAEFHKLPMLGIMEPGASFSQEARKAFADLDAEAKTAPVALVIPGSALRVMLNFILKAGALKTGSTGNVKAFDDEASAMAWLEQQI